MPTCPLTMRVCTLARIKMGGKVEKGILTSPLGKGMEGVGPPPSMTASPTTSAALATAATTAGARSGL
jgi:hypothetical protein